MPESWSKDWYRLRDCGSMFAIRLKLPARNASATAVDTLNETNALELLDEMAKKNVMVEICLTSNDVILGVRGKNHPLHDFMNAGVPVALGTDDEGVARSDMTHEYLRGVEDQDLTYADLKRMARTSLEHSFVAGSSLWSRRQDIHTHQGVRWRAVWSSTVSSVPEVS